MTLLVAIIVASLVVINYSIDRAWFYPPTIFCALWASALIFFTCVAGLFYPIGNESVLVYLIGAVGFTVGGLVVSLCWKYPSRTLITIERRTPPYIERTLNIALLAEIVAVPIFVEYMKWLNGLSSEATFWQRLRRSELDINEWPGGSGGFHLAPALLPIFSIFAVVAAFELDSTRNRLRSWILIFIAVGYQLLSATRSTLLMLLLGMLIAHAAQSRRIATFRIGACVAFFLAVFALNNVILSKQGADTSASIVQNTRAVRDGAATYFIGSLVCFDERMHDRSLSDPAEIMKPFFRIANRFGAGLHEPSRHLDFTDISRTASTNTYTVYMPLYDSCGSAGVFLVLCILGAFSTRLYHVARSGSTMGIFVAHPLYFGIVMSVFADCFSSELMYWTKLTMIVWLIYYLPTRLKTVRCYQPLRFSKEREG